MSWARKSKLETLVFGGNNKRKRKYPEIKLKLLYFFPTYGRGKEPLLCKFHSKSEITGR